MRKIYLMLTALLFVSSIQAQEPKKAELIYVSDPMCAWCYGFSGEFTKIKEHFQNQVKISLLLGGVNAYDSKKMNEDLASFLKLHWDIVGSKTGKKFNDSILNEEAFVYDIKTPSIAVLVAEDLQPGIATDFLLAVEEAFYLHSKNTNDVNTYLEIAEKLGMDAEMFAAKMIATEYDQKLEEQRAQAKELGVFSYPTLVLKSANEAEIISSGYEEANKLIKDIKKRLKKIK